jgi:hypothetical protein
MSALLDRLIGAPPQVSDLREFRLPAKAGGTQAHRIPIG